MRANSRRQLAFAQIPRAQASFDERHVRNPHAVPLFAFWVAVCIVLVSTIAPDSRVDAVTATAPGPGPGPGQQTQQFVADGNWDQSGMFS